MKVLCKAFLVLCIIMHLFGCAGLMSRSRETFLPEECKARALTFEKNGELQMALYNWKIVHELVPEDEQPAQKIAALKANIKKETARHLKKGKALFKKGSFKAARKEFLISLQYSPHNATALYYLKNRLARKGFIRYKVKAGDTFKGIARKVYRDPDMDFLVAYLMGFDIGKKPVPDSVVNLPVLNLEFSKPSMNVKTKLSEARSFFKTKDYEKTLAVLLEILAYDPKNKEALKMKNTSYFRLGKRFSLKRKYMQSLAMFQKVAPGYKGRKNAISDARKQIGKQTELHYRRGVKCFLNEDLPKAIEKWEEVLLLDPDHRKAKRDIQNARRLLEKLEQIK